MKKLKIQREIHATTDKTQGLYKTYLQIADLEKDCGAAVNRCLECLKKHKNNETHGGRPLVTFNKWSKRLQFLFLEEGFVDEHKKRMGEFDD